MIEQRIRELLAARNLSPTQFADTIGISRPIVSHILSGRNKPSLEVVQKVIAAFPDLSISWLLNGTGTMQAAELPKSLEMAPKRPTRPHNSNGLPSDTNSPVEAPATLSAAPSPISEAARPAAEPVSPPPTVPLPNLLTPSPAVGNTMAPKQSVASSEKRIKRIIIFYHDGTFSDFQPES
ncbi:helix-turn-helix domain-containing protein [Hymenobacter sediminis]|uniref:helix-turn-helix domain-containing protein n=1 Tax=Hymenobacter sediminis TaxID=2218621 RepID=UPI000DA6588F|nr:helix-turn-helix transcriptional regulator [Hymenobacter sediminis]RPD44595.1 helix-turn-helix domain-containing protein [Hymenobacter sediminis]